MGSEPNTDIFFSQFSNYREKKEKSSSVSYGSLCFCSGCGWISSLTSIAPQSEFPLCVRTLGMRLALPGVISALKGTHWSPQVSQLLAPCLAGIAMSDVCHHPTGS